MKTFFIITTLIILLFGFSVGAYVSYFKLNFKTTLPKFLSTIVLGTIFSFLVFVFSVIAIWP